MEDFLAEDIDHMYMCMYMCMCMCMYMCMHVHTCG